MIKVTTVKTTTVILPDDYKELWLKDNFYDEEDEEYKEFINMTDEEFLSDMDLIEDFPDFDIEEDEKTVIEKI